MQLQSTSASFSYNNQAGFMSSGSGFAPGNHAFNQGLQQGGLYTLQPLSGYGNFLSSGAGFAQRNNPEAAFNQGRAQGAFEAAQLMSGAGANANTDASGAAGPKIFSPSEEPLASGAPGNASSQGAGDQDQGKNCGQQCSGSKGPQIDPAQILQMLTGLLPQLLQSLTKAGGEGAGAAGGAA